MWRCSKKSVTETPENVTIGNNAETNFGLSVLNLSEADESRIEVKLGTYLAQKNVYSLFHPVLLANKADFARYVEFGVKVEEEKNKNLSLPQLFTLGRNMLKQNSKQNSKQNPKPSKTTEKNYSTVKAPSENTKKWVVLENGMLYIFNKCYNVLPEDSFSIYDIEQMDDEEIGDRNGDPDKEFVFKTERTPEKPARSLKMVPESVEDFQLLKEVLLLYYSRRLNSSNSGRIVSYV